MTSSSTRPPHAGDVGLGGGKVEIHGHHVPGLHKGRGKNILTGPALVGGKEVLHAEDLPQLGLQPVEGLASRIAVVGLHHGGELVVAHGVDAAVGEHVHKHVPVLKQEGVVARFGDMPQPLLHRRKIEFLYNTHLVHLQRDLFPPEERDLCHIRCPLAAMNRPSGRDTLMLCAFTV